MTPTEFLQVDASQHAAAIARWDDEGGASKSSRNNAGVRIAKRKHPTSRRRTTNKQKESLKCHSPG
jgi:hypothetical protein